MEKILIVEDNKALSKLIAKKIASNTAFSPEIAYSLKEAQQLSLANNYFIALLDLNLPDAPNGEIVDYMISQKIPSIILTGNIDIQTRDQIVSKDVIDYVYKGNMDDINYIFTLIERLAKNRQYKIMVVEDSLVERNRVKKMLQEQMYQVFAAAHGEEALAFLEQNKDIKLVLTDYKMPVIDGFELTKRIRQEYRKNELSIIAMTKISEEKISSRFLKIGANDFIINPFTKEELVCRVNNSIESIEYMNTISAMTNTDSLTGTSNRKYFFKEAETYFDKAKSISEPFALAMIDIDEFKNINEIHGHDIGDLVICELANILKHSTKGSDLVARFGGEEFCILIRNIEKEAAVEFFVRLRMTISKTLVEYEGIKIDFTASIGVAFSEEDSLEEMINQADMALYNAKKNGKNRVEIAHL